MQSNRSAIASALHRCHTPGERSKVAVRARGESEPAGIAGYAAMFYSDSDAGTEYRLWDDMVERIMPGCFDRAIREDDVRCLFNHDASLVLGRTASKTLRLSVDATGLRYEADPPGTETGREVVELIRRGDISGSSFGFVPVKSTYRQEKRDGQTVWIIERDEVELFDVSPVTFPAYGSASVGLRSGGDGPLKAMVDALRRECEAQAGKAATAARSVPRDVILSRARCVELSL